MKTITGDLLESTDKYIVHQTNCVTTSGAGLAHFIFKKYPYSDVYSTRSEKDCSLYSLRDNPGSITISGNGQDERYIVNLMGQLYPGGSWDDMPEDNEEMRHKFFHKALGRLAKVPNLDTVAFPYKIGCGIAGGNWEWYSNMIEKFSKHVYDNQGALVTIYQREGDI